MRYDYAPDSMMSARIFFYKAAQLRLLNGKFSEATIQAHHKLWKHPHNRLVQAAEPGVVNGEFSEKPALIHRLAGLASHFSDLSGSLWTTRAHCVLLAHHEW